MEVEEDEEEGLDPPSFLHVHSLPWHLELQAVNLRTRATYLKKVLTTCSIISNM